MQALMHIQQADKEGMQADNSYCVKSKSMQQWTTIHAYMTACVHDFHTRITQPETSTSQHIPTDY